MNVKSTACRNRRNDDCVISSSVNGCGWPMKPTNTDWPSSCSVRAASISSGV